VSVLFYFFDLTFIYLPLLYNIIFEQSSGETL